MKTRITLMCILFLFFCQPSALAQKKKASKKGISTAWTLYKELSTMIDDAKFKGKIKGPCYPTSYLKQLSKKEILFDPKKEGGIKMDSISAVLLPLNRLKINTVYGFMPIYSFINSKSYIEFVNNLYSKNIGDLRPPSFAKDVDTYYRQLKKIKKDGLVIENKTIVKKECTYQIETKFQIEKWGETFQPGTKWVNYRTTLTGKLLTNIKIACKCKGKSISALKNAQYTYEMPSIFEIDFTKRGNKQRFYLAKKRESTLNLLNVNCCTESDISFEDSSLEIIPTETVSVPNFELDNFNTNEIDLNNSNYMEAQAGFATAKDEETLYCLGLGVMFHLTNVAGNPLFAGAQASVHANSFGVQDFKSSNVKAGPMVEYRFPLGSTSTNLIMGVKGGVSFGGSENSGFKTDISGFNASIFSGVHVPLGDQLGLGVILSLVEYNNLTFKAEDSSFENKQTSTGFNFNKGSAKLSLRFNLFNGSGKIR